jgi:hypothetical protein
MVDQLLGGLFGGQDDEDEPVRRQRATDFIQRYERGAPYDSIGDDEVIQNYQTVAGRLSPRSTRKLRLTPSAACRPRSGAS